MCWGDLTSWEALGKPLKEVLVKWIPKEWVRVGEGKRIQEEGTAGAEFWGSTECVIPFTWNVQKREIYQYKWIGDCQEWGQWGMTTWWVWASFWGVENILELDRGGNCTTLWMYSVPLNCSLSNDGFYIMWILPQLEKVLRLKGAWQL